MFLVGGPAYSGTTLLALVLNQPGLTCLSEPDFHDPEQSHNGIPVLRRLYPGTAFPARDERALSVDEALTVMRQCQASILPDRLGVKFCNRTFLAYAEAFRAEALPVVAIVRDVRDALVRPLLPYVGGEEGLVHRYRDIWRARETFDTIVRYEDLVRDPVEVTGVLSRILGESLSTRETWRADEIHPGMMYPRYRHYLLESGKLDDSRIGIWRTSGKTFSREAHDLAAEMGYT